MATWALHVLASLMPNNSRVIRVRRTNRSHISSVRAGEATTITKYFSPAANSHPTPP